MITTKFETSDGTLFEDYKEAEKWDKDLFKTWLDSGPRIDLKKLLKVADNKSHEEWTGTQKDLVLSILHLAYDEECDAD